MRREEDEAEPHERREARASRSAREAAELGIQRVERDGIRGVSPGVRDERGVGLETDDAAGRERVDRREKRARVAEDEDVGGAHLKSELRERGSGVRAWELAEAAQLPGVERDVQGRPRLGVDDEQARVTTRRMTFVHTKAMSE